MIELTVSHVLDPHCSPVDEGVVSLRNLRWLLIGVRILREVAGVTGAADLRDERHWKALLAKFEPVEVLKPTVILDVVSAVAQASVTLRHVGDEQMLDEALSVPNKINFINRVVNHGSRFE